MEIWSRISIPPSQKWNYISSRAYCRVVRSNAVLGTSRFRAGLHHICTDQTREETQRHSRKCCWPIEFSRGQPYAQTCLPNPPRLQVTKSLENYKPLPSFLRDPTLINRQQVWRMRKINVRQYTALSLYRYVPRRSRQSGRFCACSFFSCKPFHSSLDFLDILQCFFFGCHPQKKTSEPQKKTSAQSAEFFFVGISARSAEKLQLKDFRGEIGREAADFAARGCFLCFFLWEIPARSAGGFFLCFGKSLKKTLISCRFVAISSPWSRISCPCAMIFSPFAWTPCWFASISRPCAMIFSPFAWTPCWFASISRPCAMIFSPFAWTPCWFASISRPCAMIFSPFAWTPHWFFSWVYKIYCV